MHITLNPARVCVCVCERVSPWCVCLCAGQQVWGTDGGSGPTVLMQELKTQPRSCVSGGKSTAADWGPGCSTDVMELAFSWTSLSPAVCSSDCLSVARTVEATCITGLPVCPHDFFFSASHFERKLSWILIQASSSLINQSSCELLFLYLTLQRVYFHHSRPDSKLVPSP